MSRTLTILFLLICCISVSAQQSAANEEKPLDLGSIRAELLFRTNGRKSIIDVNKRLIADVERRKVDFVLYPDEKENLKEAGANLRLLQAIDQNVPSELRELHYQIAEMSRLYKLVTDNYRKRTAAELKIAYDAAKEFVNRYGDDPYVKEQKAFLVALMPRIQKRIAALNVID